MIPLWVYMLFWSLLKYVSYYGIFTLFYYIVKSNHAVCTTSQKPWCTTSQKQSMLYKMLFIYCWVIQLSHVKYVICTKNFLKHHGLLYLFTTHVLYTFWYSTSWHILNYLYQVVSSIILNFTIAKFSWCFVLFFCWANMFDLVNLSDVLIFIQAMIDPDPVKRPSARELVENPIFDRALRTAKNWSTTPVFHFSCWTIVYLCRSVSIVSWPILWMSFGYIICTW